jgi:hypothetical protein
MSASSVAHLDRHPRLVAGISLRQALGDGTFRSACACPTLTPFAQAADHQIIVRAAVGELRGVGAKGQKRSAVDGYCMVFGITPMTV